MDSPLELAIKQIAFARSYMLSLLEDLDDDLWLTVPEGCSTHVAWQVAHLAMAEYGLCLFRQRGRAEVDRELLPRGFVKMYGKGSTPKPAPADNLSPAEIREILTRIHNQANQEMPAFSEDSLSESIDMPYAVYPNKLGALVFCSHHEMLHAGQIGLLRRLLGKTPIR
jgi:DinB superfamily